VRKIATETTAARQVSDAVTVRPRRCAGDRAPNGEGRRAALAGQRRPTAAARTIAGPTLAVRGETSIVA
jgi:hypothetical protein